MANPSCVCHAYAPSGRKERRKLFWISRYQHYISRAELPIRPATARVAPTPPHPPWAISIHKLPNWPISRKPTNIQFTILTPPLHLLASVSLPHAAHATFHSPRIARSPRDASADSLRLRATPGRRRHLHCAPPTRLAAAAWSNAARSWPGRHRQGPAAEPASRPRSCSSTPPPDLLASRDLGSWLLLGQLQLGVSRWC